jgi:hypothetical protein
MSGKTKRSRQSRIIQDNEEEEEDDDDKVPEAPELKKPRTKKKLKLDKLPNMSQKQLEGGNDELHEETEGNVEDVLLVESTSGGSVAFEGAGPSCQKGRRGSDMNLDAGDEDLLNVPDDLPDDVQVVRKVDRENQSSSSSAREPHINVTASAPYSSSSSAPYSSSSSSSGVNHGVSRVQRRTVADSSKDSELFEVFIFIFIFIFPFFPFFSSSSSSSFH